MSSELDLCPSCNLLNIIKNITSSEFQSVTVGFFSQRLEFFSHAMNMYISSIKRRRNLFFTRLGVLNWRHNRSQSPVFGLAVLYPTGSEIWCFRCIKTRERKIATEKNFFATLISTLGRFNRANKKKSVIYTSSLLRNILPLVWLLLYRQRSTRWFLSRLWLIFSQL